MSGKIDLLKNLAAQIVQNQAVQLEKQLSKVGFLKKSLLKPLHFGAHLLLKRLGYHWELHHLGEWKIGLWIKAKSKNKNRDLAPKRFVFIPGFGDTPLSWATLLMSCSRELRSYDEWILMDLPGFTGFLSEEKCIPSLDLLLRVMADELRNLKPDTIMGHSLGAWIAADFAIRCGKTNQEGPEPTKKSSKKEEKKALTTRNAYQGPRALILVSPSGVFGSNEKMEEWKGRFKDAMEHGISVYRPHLFSKEPKWFQFIAHEFDSFLKREDVVQFMTSFQRNPKLDEDLHFVESEVWFLWGEKDTLVPPDWCEMWFEKLVPKGKHHGKWHKGERILIPDAGHSPQLESPVQTGYALRMLLKKMNVHKARTKKRY